MIESYLHYSSGAPASPAWKVMPVRSSSWRKTLHRSHLRERLEAVLSDKARVMRLVCGKWNSPMPHVPDVVITTLKGWAKRLVVGARRARPIRSLRVQACDNARKNAAELGQVVLPDQPANFRRQCRPRAPAKGRLRLIVAAPDNNARMVPQLRRTWSSASVSMSSLAMRRFPAASHCRT